MAFSHLRRFFDSARHAIFRRKKQGKPSPQIVSPEKRNARESGVIPVDLRLNLTRDRILDRFEERSRIYKELGGSNHIARYERRIKEIDSEIQMLYDRYVLLSL